MQALEIQGIKMQALLIAMHLFFSICGIQHALCFKNYCHYSASIVTLVTAYVLARLLASTCFANSCNKLFQCMSCQCRRNIKHDWLKGNISITYVTPHGHNLELPLNGRDAFSAQIWMSGCMLPFYIPCMYREWLGMQISLAKIHWLFFIVLSGDWLLNEIP